jgi:hypothetical protein
VNLAIARAWIAKLAIAAELGLRSLMDNIAVYNAPSDRSQPAYSSAVGAEQRVAAPRAATDWQAVL